MSACKTYEEVKKEEALQKGIAKGLQESDHAPD